MHLQVCHLVRFSLMKLLVGIILRHQGMKYQFLQERDMYLLDGIR